MNQSPTKRHQDSLRVELLNGTKVACKRSSHEVQPSVFEIDTSFSIGIPASTSDKSLTDAHPIFFFLTHFCRAPDLVTASRRQLFPTVGFMDSGEGYPWYGYTVGDNSRIYTDFKRLTGMQGERILLMPAFLSAACPVSCGSHGRGFGFRTDHLQANSTV